MIRFNGLDNSVSPQNEREIHFFDLNRQHYYRVGRGDWPTMSAGNSDSDLLFAGLCPCKLDGIHQSAGMGHWAFPGGLPGIGERERGIRRAGVSGEGSGKTQISRVWSGDGYGRGRCNIILISAQIRQ